MEKINESSPMMTRGDFSRGLPFYGTRGDFNFTTGKSQFTPGISVKLVPLMDMSVKGDPGLSEFDMALAKIKMFFKPGDRVRGTIVNSQLESEHGRVMVGRLEKIVPNYKDSTIRAWVRNPSTLESFEIYVDTIERLYESESSRALSFQQFINS
jgi:hypothetical protein